MEMTAHRAKRTRQKIILEQTRQLALNEAKEEAAMNRAKQRRLIKKSPCPCRKEPAMAHSPVFGMLGPHCLLERMKTGES